MPTIRTSRPFEHRCTFCNETPTTPRVRKVEDDRLGLRYAGSYYSCRCYSLALSFARSQKANLNQTDTCTRPNLV